MLAVCFIAILCKFWGVGLASDTQCRGRQPVIVPQVHEADITLKHGLSVTEDVFVPQTHKDPEVPAVWVLQPRRGEK